MTTILTKVLFAAGVFLVGTTAAVRAQTTLIVQKKVSVSRNLAGSVDIGIAKTPAENITVEVRSSESGPPLASTKTDTKGYFHLDLPKSGGMFYLRLSAPGVNPYELRVRIRKSGPQELQIHLSNAT